MEGCVRELDETESWLELLRDRETVPNARLSDSRAETNEITEIFVVSVKTAKKRKQQ